MPETTAATFCATLVDEWVRAGVADAVVAPGSRSTPLALALAARGDLRVHVIHDERSAAFTALGLGLATGVPAVVLCTSGTAAAEFHPAVVEAHQAEVPMIVCTADRPPELRDTAAPQTIDQWHLFGRAVRWFHDPGVPDPAAMDTWRSLAARSFLEAIGRRPGPVHLNLPFREPLLGGAGAVPPPRPDGPFVRSFDGEPEWRPAQIAEVAAALDRQRGVIVAGGGIGVRDAAPDIQRLAERLAWPVLADPRSGCRTPHPNTVAAFDALLRHEGFAADHAPEVVLNFGYPPASKVLRQWLTGAGPVELTVQPTAVWIDPAARLTQRLIGSPARLCRDLDGLVRGATGTPWLARWRRAEGRAQQILDTLVTDDTRLTEPAIARTVTAALPAGAELFVSSSMPIRDVEWYGAVRPDLSVRANRGANGIDGVVSSALGVALGSGAPTALLIGDVAFLHDLSALVGLHRRAAQLTIVVVDNDGGGIFSFLPPAQELPTERFEQLFGTPHGADIPAIVTAMGLELVSVARSTELAAAVGAPSGVRVVHAVTDRAANVAHHRHLHEAVARAIG